MNANKLSAESSGMRTRTIAACTAHANIVYALRKFQTGVALQDVARASSMGGEFTVRLNQRAFADKFKVEPLSGAEYAECVCAK